ncbi:aryl-sulfate sulfotransferase [Winogradskyella sp.]|jgi:hypothetical protein|uniref:aryl-sulfate sulfotransferase n=1 Tax=Winogradskyella sp. TaxID=1883156 RepID=UPI0025FB0D9F|nr:aryl-sulfate sulfotransferase [Winogradskyella sp.]MCT4628668.1 aryl-sulfate sulfotransferase [Winogradskyella sp.]
MKNFIYSILLLFINLSNGQETIGLVFDDINKEKSEGFTLFKATSDERVFLINNCGEVVNQWNNSIDGSRNNYFLENGNLLQSSGFEAQLRDWDNNILWGINYQDEFGFRIHHDIEPLPNGNFLVLVRDVYSNTEMFAEGKDTSFSGNNFMLEKIIEIEPVGANSANIVWEWKLFDHLIQDFDSSKPNYGVVADNPQLLNMNYDGGNPENFVHANAIDYNEELDQIAISSRHLNEVFVIDHSTTTAEAASHAGGIYNKGGDFLWRWGNPAVYNMGTIDDRKLGRQHDIKWITEGPNQGKMSVFSNDGYGVDITASSIHIIDQNDSNGIYSMSLGKFLPEDYFWSYDGVILGETMLGSSRCGMQIMSNGNALINESEKGRITEVDNLGNVVWVYIIPVANNTVFNQTDDPSDNASFRAHRYPSNYVGFNGVTFNNTGKIEDVNVLTDDCVNRLSIEDSQLVGLKVYPNPTEDILNFDFTQLIDEIEVYNITGKMVLRKTDSNSINLENITKGLYMVKISVGNTSKYVKVLKN